MIINRKIFVALPLSDELENIPALLDCFDKQSFRNFEVVVCVNQPEDWWELPEKSEICRRNQATIDLLIGKNLNFLTILDRSLPGNGWDKKNFGVGWARKTVMDQISKIAGKEDIILTLDGDTVFSENYFQSIASAFAMNPGIKAIAIPYFHPLPVNNQAAALAILRYEIYMRYYALNMLITMNPYAFTALGSAIACTVQTYRSIGGITPHKSGEDFYFVQKLRKYGQVLIWLDEKVYPAARFSDRVFFGTGPAMIRGNSGDWSGYPIFPVHYFDEIKTTFDGFEELYKADIELPMSDFLREKFGESFWRPLRHNASSAVHFVRSCQHKVDGLRILQFLKWRHKNSNLTDEESLAAFFNRFYPDDEFVKQIDWQSFSFKNASVETLDRLRIFLTEKEELWRKKINVLQ